MCRLGHYSEHIFLCFYARFIGSSGITSGLQKGLLCGTLDQKNLIQKKIGGCSVFHCVRVNVVQRLSVDGASVRVSFQERC